MTLVTTSAIDSDAKGAIAVWHEPAEIGHPRFVPNWASPVAAVFAALAVMSYPLSTAVDKEAIVGMLPVEAVAFLRSQRPARPLFSSYDWGGYLIWELPQYPVFVNGRTDLYDDAFLCDYLSVIWAQDGWEETLDRYGVNLVLIEPQSMLARLLAERPGWKLAHRDSMATAFVRH